MNVNATNAAIVYWWFLIPAHEEEAQTRCCPICLDPLIGPDPYSALTLLARMHLQEQRLTLSKGGIVPTSLLDRVTRWLHTPLAGHYEQTSGTWHLCHQPCLERWQRALPEDASVRCIHCNRVFKNIL